jgi:hypothetical protein
MKLREFINTYVNHNSIIRLWYPSVNYGHIMVIDDGSDMDWKTYRGEGIYSEFLNHEVLYITSILTHRDQDAINIVIKEELGGDYDNGVPKSW